MLPVIPGYEDLVEIGQGGFAAVYRAVDQRFNRTVAIKVLTGAFDDVARARFERECRAMGVVSRHPHCVTVYDSGFTEDDHAYLVMEDMTGGAIAAQLPIGWAEAVEVGVKVAGALHAAHSAGVLHRDIKPDNVLVSAYDEPALGDFGIARLDDGLRSQTGTLSATPAYAAPELFEGHPASEASDVYSLAATLFALIVGQPPFFRDGDESYLAMIARAAREPVPDLRTRGVPDPVSAALEAGMEKNPATRVASAIDFGHRLQDAQRAAGLDATRMVGAGVPTTRGPDPKQTVIVSPPDLVTSGFWFYVDDPEELVSPHDYSRTVGVLRPGQWYLAGEQNGDWVYVVDEHGTEGWVPASAVRQHEL